MVPVIALNCLSISHLRQLEGMDDESCRVIAGPFAIGVQLFLVRGQGGRPGLAATDNRAIAPNSTVEVFQKRSSFG